MKKQELSFKPEAIIITVSQKMIGDNGYRHWLTNFLEAMEKDDWVYYFRAGNQPRLEDLLYLYLCIGGKIRYRITYGGSLPGGEKTFSDGRTLQGKAWIIGAGPVVTPPRPVIRQGFQGFRYSEMLF